MRTFTATQASRGFSDLLDTVERGDTVTITRGGHPIAVISPARRHTVDLLLGELAQLEPLDDAFASDISEALALLNSDTEDAWGDA